MRKLLPLLLILLLLSACAPRAVDAANPTAGIVTFGLLCLVNDAIIGGIVWAFTSKRLRWHKHSKLEDEE
jgi:hypothetical protein